MTITIISRSFLIIKGKFSLLLTYIEQWTHRISKIISQPNFQRHDESFCCITIYRLLHVQSKILLNHWQLVKKAIKGPILRLESSTNRCRLDVRSSFLLQLVDAREQWKKNHFKMMSYICFFIFCTRWQFSSLFAKRFRMKPAVTARTKPKVKFLFSNSLTTEKF